MRCKAAQTPLAQLRRLHHRPVGSGAAAPARRERATPRTVPCRLGCSLTERLDRSKAHLATKSQAETSQKHFSGTRSSTFVPRPHLVARRHACALAPRGWLFATCQGTQRSISKHNRLTKSHSSRGQVTCTKCPGAGRLRKSCTLC